MSKEWEVHLIVYCDTPDCERRINPGQFISDAKSKCNRKARGAGWYVGREIAYCPSCNHENH